MFTELDTDLEIRVARLSSTAQLAFNGAQLAARRFPSVDFGDGFQTLLGTFERLPHDERVSSDALEALRVFWSNVG